MFNLCIFFYVYFSKKLIKNLNVYLDMTTINILFLQSTYTEVVC